MDELHSWYTELAGEFGDAGAGCHYKIGGVGCNSKLLEKNLRKEFPGMHLPGMPTPLGLFGYLPFRQAPKNMALLYGAAHEQALRMCKRDCCKNKKVKIVVCCSKDFEAGLKYFADTLDNQPGLDAACSNESRPYEAEDRHKFWNEVDCSKL